MDERGQTAIVLVPEIALTPQTVDRFRAVFGDRIAVLHSALSDGERYDAWLALKRGEKRIAVGARSAIFAPLENLGAIIVDEEHESSYKQGETPRYHAREVAIVRARERGRGRRARQRDASLESWANATTGKYTLLTLPDRVGGGRLPDVEVVDLRKLATAYSRDGARRDRLRRGDPRAARRRARRVPRAGRAEHPAAQSARLLVVRAVRRLRRRGDVSELQHHPHATTARPSGSSATTACTRKIRGPIARAAAAGTCRQRGLGTQQVERLLAERFPSARIARMDVDTTSGKWAHTRDSRPRRRAARSTSCSARR